MENRSSLELIVINLYIIYVLCLISRVSIAHVLPQDIQSEIPSHLLRLKVEVEQNRVAAILADCRGELDREMRALSGTCTSERVLKEHRVGFFFGFYRDEKIRNMNSQTVTASFSPLLPPGVFPGQQTPRFVRKEDQEHGRPVPKVARQ